MHALRMPCCTRLIRKKDQSTKPKPLVAGNSESSAGNLLGSSSADQQKARKPDYKNPPTPPPKRKDMPTMPQGTAQSLLIFFPMSLIVFPFLDIDVAKANSLTNDHEIVLTPPTISSRLHKQEVNAMSPPTHVVIPPTPVTAITNTERDRPSSEPEISLPSLTPSSSPPQTTPYDELDDPLSEQWRQSPKLSYPLLRRLSGHRRSKSLTGDLQGTASNPAPEHRRENDDDDDIVLIPAQLQGGMEMLRVTRKKITKRICWIDPISACVAWDSKNSSRCRYLTRSRS
jgi:hypothetical protein